MISGTLTSLAWVRSQGDALLDWRQGTESSTGSTEDRWPGKFPAT